METKTINVTIEVYDDTSVEDIEQIIQDALEDNEVECLFNVD